jgi:hypothetical protein
MRCFKTKAFARFARKNDIDDATLRIAHDEISTGRFDADLGGGLFKQRIARDGKGKSKGFRVLIAFHSAKRTVFLFGFGKNEKGNIDVGELEDAKDIAAAWLSADENRIERAIGNGVLIEVQK